MKLHEILLMVIESEKGTANNFIIFWSPFEGLSFINLFSCDGGTCWSHFESNLERRLTKDAKYTLAVSFMIVEIIILIN